MAAESMTTKLDALFEAERTVRNLHRELAMLAPAALLPALRDRATPLLENEDDPEAAAVLTRVAALAGEFEGGAAVDLLIDLLGAAEPEARHAAGEALEELAFDRFKEVALGVERALERLPQGHSALTELPYLLAEVAEPGCTKLLGRFLQSPDAEAVSSAIEALVELGDPAAIPLLAPLEGDRRTVQLEGEDDEAGSATLGELAAEARALLAEMTQTAEPRGKSEASRPGGSR